MLRLKRAYLDNCTIGKLYYKGEFICYTIERPWLNNEKSVSCIPEGEYILEPYESAKHPDCFYLGNNNLGVGFLETHQRTYILIHVGNFVNDIQGCIAPGLSLHPSRWGVSDSKKAMDKLRALIKANEIDKILIEG
jgi:hypothetical protein